MNGTPREVFGGLGRNLLEFLTLADSLSFCRIMVAEAVQAPELGRIFYAQGPARGHHELARYLGCAARRGEIALPRTRARRQTLSRGDCRQLPDPWAHRSRP
jgi:TetR/AcrR family transcriptional regulator, mexJK operon transcriptional repressor